MDTRIAGSRVEHLIGHKHPTTIIGNSIDTDTHPLLSQSLLDGDFSIVKDEAIHQVKAGAHVLLLKINAVGLDEEIILPKVIKIVSETVPVPVCISTQNTCALDEALKVCPGKPIFYSVSSEEESLSRFLPLLVRAGVALIGKIHNQLSQQSENGYIVEHARHLLRRCISAGVARENIILDSSGISFFDDPADALALVNAYTALRRIEDINLVLHPSDLVKRLSSPDEFEQAFTILAIQSGATCLFAEPVKIIRTVLTTDRLLGKLAYHD